MVQERLDGTVRIARYGRYFDFKQVQTRPHVPEQLRRDKPRPVVVARPKLPRNPFFGGMQIANKRSANNLATAVLS